MSHYLRCSHLLSASCWQTSGLQFCQALSVIIHNLALLYNLAPPIYFTSPQKNNIVITQLKSIRYEWKLRILCTQWNLSGKAKNV